METKQCTMCKRELPKTEEFFATRVDRKTKQFQSACRSCQREYRKLHYNRNKKRYISKAKSYNKKIILWFQEIKKDLECENCGENRPWVLDFHHLDPDIKDGNIATICRGGSKRKILEEISKCKVLCSNCHRDLHYKEKQAS